MKLLLVVFLLINVILKVSGLDPCTTFCNARSPVGVMTSGSCFWVLTTADYWSNQMTICHNTAAANGFAIGRLAIIDNSTKWSALNGAITWPSNGNLFNRYWVGYLF